MSMPVAESHVYPLEQVKEFFFRLVPELDNEKWKLFESVATIRQVPKGALILKPGMKSDFVSFINRGLVRSYYLVDGKEMVNFFAHEGRYFSEYETFLAQTTATKYSEALEDCELVDLSYNDLQFLYRSLPECERAGRRIAEELFVQLCGRINSFLTMTPEERYIEFLEQFPSLPQRVPQYMIASFPGVTPEALSRIRSRMARKPIARFIDSDQ